MTSARRRLRLPLSGRVGAAVVVVSLVAASANGAAAEGTPAGTPSASNATVAQAAVGAAAANCSNQAPSWAAGLPPIPCLTPVPNTPTRYQDYGLVLDPVKQNAGKPKIAFTFPTLVSRAFTVICSATKGSTPCPEGLTLPPQDTSVTPQYLGVAADIYVEGDKGENPPWGAFPSVQVSAYAFGALPSTVDLTIRQRFDGDVAVPLKLAWFTSSNVTPGKEIPGYEEYGPAPTPPAGENPYFFAPPAHITGTVDVQIDKVSIDGVELPVGGDCKAAADVDLTSTGGFYVSAAKPVRGEPGEYQPLATPAGYLHQDGLNVHAFTGCRNGSEDVSDLFTGIVSGTNNSVDAYQPGTLQYFGCLAGQTRTCTQEHPPTYYPPGSN